MLRGPVERFVGNLNRLIRDELDMPLDDRLTYIEIIGALETQKARLLNDCNNVLTRDDEIV